MTTLLCIPLAGLLARRLPFPTTGLLRCFCEPAAAAIEIPAADDRNEKKPRRKFEENSLTVVADRFLEVLVDSFRAAVGGNQLLIFTLDCTIS
jgi:hypothetical protein